MEKIKVVQNPFKQKGRGIKVYSSKRQPQEGQEPADTEESKECNCAMCKAGKQITREVRGQFNKYGKI